MIDGMIELKKRHTRTLELSASLMFVFVLIGIIPFIVISYSYGLSGGIAFITTYIVMMYVGRNTIKGISYKIAKKILKENYSGPIIK